MSDEDKKNVPVIRISITGTVGDKCQMSFETYLAADSDVKLLNAMTDKLMFVRDRHVAKAELVDLKKLFETETNALQAIKEDLQRVDTMHASNAAASEKKGMRVARGLNDKEKTERHNLVVNIDHRTKRLAQMEKDIKAREALAGE